MSKYTHIRIIRWTSNGCDKLYGTIIVDGAMSAEKLTELRSYLDESSGFIPARLKGIDFNNISGKWHEMRVDDAEVLDSALIYGYEDIEPEHVDLAEFLVALRAASRQGWKTDKQLKAERRVALKREARDVLAAFRTYMDCGHDDSTGLQRRFIEAAVGLAEKVAGTTEERNIDVDGASV